MWVPHSLYLSFKNLMLNKSRNRFSKKKTNWTKVWRVKKIEKKVPKVFLLLRISS